MGVFCFVFYCGSAVNYWSKRYKGKARSHEQTGKWRPAVTVWTWTNVTRTSVTITPLPGPEPCPSDIRIAASEMKCAQALVDRQTDRHDFYIMSLALSLFVVKA
jgi:hypothetical protein